MIKTCFCGCGRRVSRTFAPGHDTKFIFEVLRENFGPLGGATIAERLAEVFPDAAKRVQEKNGGKR